MGRVVHSQSYSVRFVGICVQEFRRKFYQLTCMYTFTKFINVGHGGVRGGVMLFQYFLYPRIVFFWDTELKSGK